MPGDDRPRAFTNKTGGLHGRRQGKKLSAHRADLMARLLPALKIDLAERPPGSAADLFPLAIDSVRLEIGFGGGEYLVGEAAAAPSTGFIGVEPYVNGMAKAVAAIAARGLRNVRLFDGDAAELLDWLPRASLARVDILYPDPWPKKRHWKRRFVNAENLTRIARVLLPKGVFRFATDIESYAEWTREKVAASRLLTPTGEREDAPWPDWPGTRYEAKAARAGRGAAYLTFRKAG